MDSAYASSLRDFPKRYDCLFRSEPGLYDTSRPKRASSSFGLARREQGFLTEVARISQTESLEAIWGDSKREKEEPMCQGFSNTFVRFDINGSWALQMSGLFEIDREEY
jgi:hypothetical protein